jgi:2',3'-cyclic-nucleotide 2'-phosphodiesterase (5'-nucleotidase family)
VWFLIWAAGYPAMAEPAQGRERRAVLLAINDVYRIEGIEGGTRGGLARVRALRRQLEQRDPELLLLHAGDFLYPSLLSKAYEGEQMVAVLNRLDGSDDFDRRMFVTIGNHEFEAKRADVFRARLEQSQFTWVASNVRFIDGFAADTLRESRIVETGGIKVGVFGLTSQETTRPYYVQAITDPEIAAQRIVADLRSHGAEVVVAITHMPMHDDLRIMARLGSRGPDLIVGGHEHEQAARRLEDGRLVIKADAEARTATLLTITLAENGRPNIAYEFKTLENGTPEPDRALQAVVAQWQARFEADVCAKRYQLGPGCLDTIIGRTTVPLDGEELSIRRYETNLGNWVANEALRAFAADHAQIAFINSGCLRLNANIAAGPIRLRDIEELLQYPTSLKLIRLDGRTLKRVVARAIAEWTGSGHWLQIAGFAFRHDASNPNGDGLTLLAPAPRAIHDDEEFLAVVTDFLVDPSGNQDGYSFLTAEHIVPGKTIELRKVLIDALEKSQPLGITPRIEGRICGPRKEKLCLAR